MDLTKMADDVYEVNVANGWFDEDRGLEADVALLHSEVSELFEAYRSRGFDDFSAVRIRDGQEIPQEVADILQRFMDARDLEALGVTENVSPLTPEERMTLCAAGVMKPEGAGSELADILIRLLDTAKRRGWKVETVELSQRLIKADLVLLVNELHAWSDAIRGWQDRGEGGPVALDYIYAIVRLVAKTGGIDLQAECERKLAYNRTGGHRHGGKRL